MSGLCGALLAEQTGNWLKLREGYRAQEAAEIRTVSCPGFNVRVQWNPQRIVSTAAKVDPASLNARPCFLCLENLPEAQRAILYRNEYLVLCNPAPIFARHYTISHLRHRPQQIEPVIGIFLSLMRDLSPNYSLLYNGPRSGASAPDHQHFQAAPVGTLPVETDIHASGKLRSLKIVEEVEVFRTAGLGRAVLVLKGVKQECIAAVLLRVVAAMRKAFRSPDEPMMNLLGSHRDGRWMILVFPRARHRPAVYDLDGEERMLITPASVEMGGFFITPVEKDFRALDAGLVQVIYRDVSVDEESVSRLINDL